MELSKQIKSAHDQISALEKAHRNVGEEVSSLVSQNDEFSVQQRKLSKAMQKLERNLEDMTDTFHRSQTDIVRKTSTQANAVDETTINKIRGTIFDMQEQQSKFQNQVDSMLQDTKNKEKVFENMKAEIKDLKVNFLAFLSSKFINKITLASLRNHNANCNAKRRGRHHAVVGVVFS